MQGLRARFSALAAQRLRAPLPPGGGKKGGIDRGPAKTGQLSSEVCTGLALKKGEADPPLKPDSEYPEWLWKLLETPASVTELERKYQKEGLTMAEMKRLYRYKNKERIKEQNALRAKK